MSLHVAIFLVLLLCGLGLNEKGEQQNSSGVSTSGACHGWRCYNAKELQEGLLTRLPSGQEAPFCDFEILHAEAIPDDMYGDSRLTKRPFILRNDAKLRSLQKKFGRESVLKAGRSNSLTARVGRSWEIVMHRGEGPKNVSLSQYVKRIMRKNDAIGEKRLERNYAFDRHARLLGLPGFVFRVHPLINSFNRTAFTPQTADPIFLLGGPESGIGFHRHAAAIQMTMHGWKRWFFFAPEKLPPGGVRGAWPILDWLQFVYPELSEGQAPMECVQQPSDILYIPEGWYHAVINLADSVAVSLQRKHLETEALMLEFAAKNATNIEGQRKRLKRLLKLQPGNLEALFFLSRSLKSASPVKAAKLLSKAISQDPFFVDAQYDLATLLTEKSREGTPDALQEFINFLREWKPFLENNTFNLQANHMLAQFYSLTGQNDIGLEHLRRNVELQAAGITSIWAPDFKPILRHAMQAQ